ncbi:MAG: cytochrome oxidase putative small subunit CydP [Azonexus sp.]
MSQGNTRLRREIYAIVVIKLLVIFGLWWAFIRDARVEVDGQRLAEHLAQPAGAATPRLHSGETHAQ